MFNVGGGEFLIILLVALVVLGPTRLPDAARQVGKIMGEFRRMSASFQREMQSAMNDPVSKVTGQETPKSLTDVTQTATAPVDPENRLTEASDTPLSETPETLKESPTFTSAEPPKSKDAVSDADGGADSSDDGLAGDPAAEITDEPPEAPMFGDR